MKRNLTALFIIATASLLAAQWIGRPNKSSTNSRLWDEKVNLALRQTGHILLSCIGNDTSAIPPIKKRGGNEFLLRLEDNIGYDTLPYVLSEAFKDFGVEEKYQVAIKNCQTDTLVLGYNFLAFENNNIACMGREQISNCSNIYVSFPEKTDRFNSQLWIIWGLLLLSFFMGWLYFSQRNKNAAIVEDFGGDEGQLKLGDAVFNYKNQTVEINGKLKNLTFRENKLLRYFSDHPNQVLDRETILSSVWGDEGVVVSRSLDVFVSRLRKILKEDENVQIKNVHGVGYRLEVSNDH